MWGGPDIYLHNNWFRRLRKLSENSFDSTIRLVAIFSRHMRSASSSLVQLSCPSSPSSAVFNYLAQYLRNNSFSLWILHSEPTYNPPFMQPRFVKSVPHQRPFSKPPFSALWIYIFSFMIVAWKEWTIKKAMKKKKEKQKVCTEVYSNNVPTYLFFPFFFYELPRIEATNWLPSKFSKTATSFSLIKQKKVAIGVILIPTMQWSTFNKGKRNYVYISI